MKINNKKLLSEVLGDDNSIIGEYAYISKHKNYIHIGVDNSVNKEKKINLYELMHLYKKWASSNGYNIESSDGYMGDNKPYARLIEFNGCEYPMCESDTEFNAVIKCCETLRKD